MTFDEDLELLVPDVAQVDLNLEREQDGEEELVDLVQAAARVLKHLVGQVLDDVVDALAVDGRLGGVRHGDVKQAQELLKGRLVHLVHHRHLHDQEVQDAAACGHCNSRTYKLIKKSGHCITNGIMYSLFSINQE